MKLPHLLTTAALTLSLAAGTALAQDDKAKKQAEVRKATATSLGKFYKEDPKLKEAVTNAPGYAVFTTYGLSFLIGARASSRTTRRRRSPTWTWRRRARAYRSARRKARR